MYFITEQDPNYSIKGSRDPLGFQVVWQAAGRKLIPNLSTVSGSIKDFQILCLAYAIQRCIFRDIVFLVFSMKLFNQEVK